MDCLWAIYSDNIMASFDVQRKGPVCEDEYFVKTQALSVSNCLVNPFQNRSDVLTAAWVCYLEEVGQ